MKDIDEVFVPSRSAYLTTHTQFKRDGLSCMES